MKNGARYIVTTRWGIFSLDEGSYQDYLAGTHWISWEPGQQKQPRSSAPHIPDNISQEAIALRDMADKIGVFETLQNSGLTDAAVPYSQRLADVSIDEMTLTVRSSNGLKRANIHTFGQLKDRIDVEDGLATVRNIGQKSIAEIRRLFYEECYTALLPYEKALYWQKLLDKKSPQDMEETLTD